MGGCVNSLIRASDRRQIKRADPKLQVDLLVFRAGGREGRGQTTPGKVRRAFTDLRLVYKTPLVITLLAELYLGTRTGA